MIEIPLDFGSFKGVGLKAKLRLNFRLKGYVSRQYLWILRWGNGYATTMLLEVFTQRNFVAVFIRLKLNFIEKKQKKSLFVSPFGVLTGNIRTLFIARWKARIGSRLTSYSL